MGTKPYDSEQLRTIALGVLGAGWYVLTNPENARDVIRRLLATIDAERAEPRHGCLGCPMVDGKCPHCGNEVAP